MKTENNVKLGQTQKGVHVQEDAMKMPFSTNHLSKCFSKAVDKKKFLCFDLSNHHHLL